MNKAGKKIKKKYIVLSIILVICLLLGWYAYEFFQEWECQDYPKFKKANEIIQKVEDYRKHKGKLPNIIEDIGEKYDEGGPIFYEKVDADNYEIMFGTTLGSSCIYESKTKAWTRYPVG